MRRLSLNARLAYEREDSDEVEIVLLVFEHPSISQPIRLSTDNTERLAEEPDLVYGTRSTWMDADPETDPYLFVIASAELPGESEDAPAAATIVLENVTNDIAALLRSFTSRATAHMAVVLASSPDVVEFETRNMKLVAAEGDAGEISLSLTRAPVEEETVPTDRFTKSRFPGMFR